MKKKDHEDEWTLNEIRKNSMQEAKPTTGDGLEWGVLFAIGPGLTVETVIFLSVRIDSAC